MLAVCCCALSGVNALMVWSKAHLQPGQQCLVILLGKELQVLTAVSEHILQTVLQVGLQGKAFFTSGFSDNEKLKCS